MDRLGTRFRRCFASEVEGHAHASDSLPADGKMHRGLAPRRGLCSAVRSNYVVQNRVFKPIIQQSSQVANVNVVGSSPITRF